MLNLAEAVKRKSTLMKRLQKLESELFRNATVTQQLGAVRPIPARTVEVIDREMQQLQSDVRALDVLIYKANISHTVAFEGEDLSLVEAIELAKQLRARAALYDQLSSFSKEEFESTYGESAPIVRVATFDPERYRLAALAAEEAAEQLSSAVNTANYSVAIPFESSSPF